MVLLNVIVKGEEMKYYKISEDELLNLLKSARTLEGLEGAGVDNWEGCDYVGEILEDYPEPTLESINEEYEQISTYICTQCDNKVIKVEA
jgi:hypothetical protein